MIKIKKKIVFIIGLVALVCISIISVSFTKVQADSGWDSDYDSGWSSGGSSWDSGWSSGGSSSDYDWGSSSSGSGWSSSSYSTGNFTIDFIIPIIVIIIILSSVSLSKGNKKKYYNYGPSNTNYNYRDIDINKIKEIDPSLNIDEFKEKAFNIYKDIQIAWMNFDTDTIRKLTTDELYNMYSSQLETLKLKKQKNIMENIEYIDAKITNITKENDVIKVSTYLNVRCHDYVVKEDTNEVVRGRKNAKINIKYMLTFVKSSSNNKIVEKCPNCGAPVDIKSSAVCEYCDSTLVKVSGEYVLSKKVSLGQNLER